MLQIPLDDPAHFSLAGHHDRPIWHPHDPGSLEAVIDAAGLGPGSTALDVGCGAGAISALIVERTPATVTAVDYSPAAIAHGQALYGEQAGAERIRWTCAPFEPGAHGSGFDLIVCIGSTHVVGGFAPAIEALGRQVSPGGRLLIGDGFWRRTPDQAYLDAFFGGRADEMPTMHEALARARAQGWRPTLIHAVSDAGWADYERSHNRSVRRWAERAATGDAAHRARATQYQDRSDRWFAGWKRWGHDTFGFALWLFERVA